MKVEFDEDMQYVRNELSLAITSLNEAHRHAKRAYFGSFKVKNINGIHDNKLIINIKKDCSDAMRKLSAMISHFDSAKGIWLDKEYVEEKP